MNTLLPPGLARCSRLGEQLASQIAFPTWHSTRVSQGGKWILSSACCSWNCKHSASHPPACSPAQGVRGTFASPPPLLLLTERKKRGRPGLLLVGHCSQMEPVKACQPQIHTERATSAFLECVTAGFTFCSPQFNNMSSSFSLTQS